MLSLASDIPDRTRPCENQAAAALCGNGVAARGLAEHSQLSLMTRATLEAAEHPAAEEIIGAHGQHAHGLHAHGFHAHALHALQRTRTLQRFREQQPTHLMLRAVSSLERLAAAACGTSDAGTTNEHHVMGELGALPETSGTALTEGSLATLAPAPAAACDGATSQGKNLQV